jgi:hypothetical protein
MLSSNEIELELKVIEKIDKIYFKEADHCVRDVIGYDARQARRAKLQIMMEVQKIENRRKS